MKKILSKIHLYLSLPVGLIISIICLTGSAMVFDKELHQLFNQKLYHIKKAERGALPLNVLIEKNKKHLEEGETVGNIQVFPDKSMTYQFAIKGDNSKTFFVDQYTGELLGVREKYKKGGFYRTMFHMHRWLMSRGDDRIIPGKEIVGISTLLLVIIIISGFFIWLPRGIYSLKKALSIRITKGWRRFWYDLHVAGGVYIGVGLLVLALTGLMWSFSWYRPAVYSLFGVEQNLKSSRKSKNDENKTLINYEFWNSALEEVKLKENNVLYLTVKDGEVVAYNRKYGNVRAHDTYLFNPSNGDINDVILYSTKPETSRFMGWVYSIHVGTWGGLWSKILTFIVAFLGGILPITGYYLWFKKEFSKNKKQRV